MRPSKPPFGRGGSSSSSNSQRSHTPNTTTASSWRTIAKRGNQSSPSQAFYKGINDMIGHENNPEPFTNIVKKDIEWTTKTKTDVLLYLEKEDIPSMKDPERLRQKYLDSAYYPTLSLKSRAWLKTIVMQKGMEITHFWSNDNHSVPPNFSKCIIREVILPRNWAITPNQELPLVKASNSKEIYYFNYWDYKEAFYNIFLYQNPKIKHTWLIKLCPEAVHKGLPTWFFEWWTTYGPDLAILPKAIQELYSPWLENHPAISKLREEEIIENLCIIYFYAETEIPWIWTWSLEADWTEGHLPYLKRQYHYRWWTGIIIEEKVKQISEIIGRNTKALESAITHEVQRENPMLKIAKMMRRKYPQVSDVIIQQKCLDYIKGQFFELFDTEDSKSTRSKDSNEDTPIPDIQDAQDPEDGIEDVDTLWEAAMGVLENLDNIPINSKGKEKEEQETTKGISFKK